MPLAARSLVVTHPRQLRRSYSTNGTAHRLPWRPSSGFRLGPGTDENGTSFLSSERSGIVLAARCRWPRQFLAGLRRVPDPTHVIRPRCHELVG
jgi:hypothetical protein